MHKTYDCNGMEGRYINVVNPGVKQHLTLCELEVDSQRTQNLPTPAGNIQQNTKASGNEHNIVLHIFKNT